MQQMNADQQVRIIHFFLHAGFQSFIFSATEKTAGSSYPQGPCVSETFNCPCSNNIGIQENCFWSEQLGSGLPATHCFSLALPCIKVFHFDPLPARNLSFTRTCAVSALVSFSVHVTEEWHLLTWKLEKCSLCMKSTCQLCVNSSGPKFDVLCEFFKLCRAKSMTIATQQWMARQNNAMQCC